MASHTDKYIPALSFDRLTPLYDLVVRWTTNETAFKKALVNQMNLRSNARVLDLGCGTGTLTIAIKRQSPSAEVHGLDGDPRILEIARKKAEQAAEQITLTHGLSFELPYHDASFDVMASSLFFHHLTPENKQRTLAEVFRVLTNGGELHVADWGKANNALMAAASLPVQWLDGPRTKDSFQGLLPEYVREAGFFDVTETTSFNSLFGTIRLFKARKP